MNSGQTAFYSTRCDDKNVANFNEELEMDFEESYWMDADPSENSEQHEVIDYLFTSSQSKCCIHSCESFCSIKTAKDDLNGPQ